MAWVIDPAHTTVGFTARHMGLSTVRGRFTAFDGEIELDPSNLATAAGRIEIDMASVESGNEQRDQHLATGDFFDVKNYPKMTFDVKSVTPAGEDTYKVVGALTIKNVTNDVELSYEHAGEGTDPYGNRRLGGSLRGSIKRSDWGLKWNVPLESGGWLVSNKINLEIDGQLTESSEAVTEGAGVEAKAS